MFNAFQWNCFNLVHTCNIALILLLKWDVTKFRILPPLVTQCKISSTPPSLTCDVISTPVCFQFILWEANRVKFWSDFVAEHVLLVSSAGISEKQEIIASGKQVKRSSVEGLDVAMWYSIKTKNHNINSVAWYDAIMQVMMWCDHFTL